MFHQLNAGAIESAALWGEFVKYRREIDGLRAVAVLPVILFHAGFEAFAGGFVGVDVFFVISGYLITTIILSDMNNGKFSIITFYERRARRILPALFFVMFCCLPFAWFWLLPNHLKDFAQSLTAITAFSSNILFWKESGYFGTAGELKPLLHTWSLAVEEQYYVLFPLFLMALWKLRKRWIFGSLVVMAFSSLILAQWGAYNIPTATFFLLPMRGWELAIGALIAFYFLYKKEQAQLITSHKTSSEALGALGLALIGYSIFTFDQSTPFPGVYALIPTLGTALIIIFSTADTVVGRLLSTKSMVGIGLLSYSTYLWHQPLFAFARHRRLEDPSVALLLVLSVMSIVLAYFTWRFVEVPFRDKNTFNREKIFKFAVLGSMIFASIGLAGHFNIDSKYRYDDVITRLSSPESGIEGGCEETLKYSGETCVMGDRSVNPTIAILGDSNSTRLTKRFSETLKTKKLSAVVYAQSWGVPLLDVGTDTVGKLPSNRSFMSQAFNEIKNNKNIKTVILVAEWANYTKGMRYPEKVSAYYTDKESIGKTLDENINVFGRGVDRTFKILKESDKKIIIVGSIPEHQTKFPDTILKSYIKTGNIELPDKYKVKYSNYLNRNREVIEAFEKSGVSSDVTYIDAYGKLCEDENCKLADVYNNAYYSDASHLSYYGSIVIVDEILRHL